MMIQTKTKPKYRIHYKECSHDRSHQGEKLNFVCLNQKCNENSLICSMCREDAHKGHTTQPLKFYIQALKQQYESDKTNYSIQFESLDEWRSLFFHKLKESVQKVAKQFMKLQQQIMNRFEQLKNQLTQNQSKKNKFAQFYQSLITESQDKPQFFIQNYLPKKSLSKIDTFEPIQQLGKKLAQHIIEIRESVFTIFQASKPIVQNTNGQFKLASSVMKTGNLYAQTVNNIGAPSLSAISIDLIKNFQTSRIKIRVARIKKGGYIQIGAIQKGFFNSLNHKNPIITQMTTLKNKIFYYSNTGQVFGQVTSQLKTFSQGSNIEVSMNGNIMRITMKKHSAEFALPTNGEFFFFFNLQGPTQIQLIQVPK